MEVKIKLNKCFYSKAAINNAITAFLELGNIQLYENDSQHIINFQSEENIDNLEKEFCNFVLANMRRN